MLGFKFHRPHQYGKLLVKTLKEGGLFSIHDLALPQIKLILSIVPLQ